MLTTRALNRATLARQLLLERATLTPLATVEHLVGLQAQVPHNPYTASGRDSQDFRPESLSELLERREVVRVGVMRGTIHLVTADDCLLLRPLMQPVLEAQLRRHREHAPALETSTWSRSSSSRVQLLAESPAAGPSCARSSRSVSRTSTRPHSRTRARFGSLSCRCRPRPLGHGAHR